MIGCGPEAGMTNDYGDVEPTPDQAAELDAAGERQVLGIHATIVRQWRPAIARGRAWLGDALDVLVEHALACPVRVIPACTSCGSTGWVCSVCDHVVEDARGQCDAFHPGYGFTCPYLPRDHGGPHFDPSGGHWTAAGQLGQVYDVVEDNDPR